MGHDILTLPCSQFHRVNLYCVNSYFLPTCILTRILTCLLNYLLTHSPTHLIKYIHTRIKFNIAVYQDITIYYHPLLL